MAVEKDISSIPKSDNILEPEVELEIETSNFQEGGAVNVEMTDDGGAEIDFDPSQKPMEGGQLHEANLAEFMEDDALNNLASELQESYDEYKSSRSDWEDGYIKGLDLLGFKYENRSEPFQGASGATHQCLQKPSHSFKH